MLSLSNQCVRTVFLYNACGNMDPKYFGIEKWKWDLFYDREVVFGFHWKKVDDDGLQKEKEKKKLYQLTWKPFFFHFMLSHLPVFDMALGT